MRDDFKTIYGYSVVKTDFDFVTTNVSISFFDEYIYRRLELNL